MKILLTINDITLTGGTERVVTNLANALYDIGYEVCILSFFRANDTLPYKINDNIELIFWYNLSESSHRDRFLKSRILKIYYKNLHKIILSIQLHKRYFDCFAIIANCSIFRPLFKNKNTIYIKIMHLNFSAFNKRNSYFDDIVILSSRELALWQHYYKSIKVIPNFIPHISHKSSNLDSKMVLSIGRFSHQKGFLRLIDIWKQVIQDKNLKDWKLCIVGDGELKIEIETKIKMLNLQDYIILKPFTKDIEKEYLRASIYVMTSYFEGFGMVLSESASYGLPAIAFDINTGPSDIIEDNVSGYLIEDNNLEDFALKLQNLMNNKALRDRFGTSAKQIIRQKFSKEVIMPLWEKILKKKQ
ncbi:glycosyltransferase family 4 protein [Helicobacter sp. MIT 99-5507]|uniref:glycosyltransferase family 4 protein n=1 Tax=Helicobacter sp. MIT 99-5507 TaxID=152489 RepID=UPI000E1F2FE1|nr:glycosyltransferase family 4 protein [Helicobacter sp. MIT 99-5507]RDU56635.1 glycosyltransferase family 4 protein [Helicobacter sp. MIT 99-5507]